MGDIVTERTDVTEIPADAGTAAIRAQSRASGHRRLLVRDTDRFVGVVHVRDSLDRDATAAELMRPVLRLPSDMPVYEALRRMRETRNHLALVVRADGAGDVVTGLVTLTDMLHRLLPPVAAAH